MFLTSLGNFDSVSVAIQEPFWGFGKATLTHGVANRNYNMKIKAVSGDLTQTPSDAIITAVNSGGMWFGGIDAAIQRVAGMLFHQQVQKALPLRHGDTVVAKANGTKHGGSFSNVVFVIDDLQGPLHEVIRNGLTAAAKAGFKSVCLPTIRMGVMLGQVEKTTEKAVNEMVEGVRMFKKQSPPPIRSQRHHFCGLCRPGYAGNAQTKVGSSFLISANLETVETEVELQSSRKTFKFTGAFHKKAPFFFSFFLETST